MGGPAAGCCEKCSTLRVYSLFMTRALNSPLAFLRQIMRAYTLAASVASLGVMAWAAGSLSTARMSM